jgi:hypothetical protein
MLSASSTGVGGVEPMRTSLFIAPFHFDLSILNIYVYSMDRH